MEVLFYGAQPARHDFDSGLMVYGLGIHLVLFCICVCILLTRRNPVQPVVFFSVVIMFALATADMSLSFRVVIQDIPALLNSSIDYNGVAAHIYPKNPLFVTNKYVTSLHMAVLSTQARFSLIADVLLVCGPSLEVVT